MVDVKQVPITAMMRESIEPTILEAYRTADEEHLVLYLENQESIENFKIDLEKISQLAPHGVTLTAQSSEKILIMFFVTLHQIMVSMKILSLAQHRHV